MTKAEAIGWFKTSYALAKALNISSQAVYNWGEKIPETRQFQIQVITNGALKADSFSDTDSKPEEAA